MQTRGRKSAAQLSIVQSIGSQKPQAPEELNAEQSEEWDAVVGRMPHGWFTRENEALLVTYCRHVVKARILAEEIDNFNPSLLSDGDELVRYEKLLKMAEREGRSMVSLARSMRMTQQSRYRADKAAPAVDRAGNGTKPWQIASGQ